MATNPEGLTTATGSNRSPLVRGAAILAGVLLLLLLVWFLFLRSDDEIEQAATPAPVVVEEANEEEDISAAPTKKDPVETFEVFAPKDPFDPLISAATSGGGTGSATSGTAVAGTTTATSGDTTTTAGDGTTTTTTTTDPNGGSRGGEDIGGHRVRVIDVYSDGGERVAQVQVDGTVYTVKENERFAENFQLLSTSGSCATMLFGDDEFTLCEGEEILK